jgi:SWI/SNF-related matrix-associated actin-dependent regulator 1 of chromatin subfamily A
MFGNYYMFATKYCGAKKVKIGSKSVMKLEGPTNVEELNTILRANYMVRRMKTDVMKDLPEKMKDVIILNEDDLDGLVQKEKKALADGKAH